MARLASVLVGFVALEHIWFLIFEMFLWQTPIALRVFKSTAALSKDTAVLAANQGFYNGILAAGLIWSLMATEPTEALHLKTFFLLAVLGAGLYGGLSAFRSILVVQALPALIALILVRMAG